MNPVHKQRVIGAAVLVALGLIIVPALLDFSRDEQVDMKGVEIPPGPDAMRMEVLPLEQWSQKVEPGVEAQQPPAAEADVVKSSEPPAPIPDEVDVAVSAPAPSEAKPAAPAPATKPAPAAKAEAAAVTEGWVLQVASLTVETKANELRDQLRKTGYPVFIERGKSGGSVVYRVKAGPVADRAAADELKMQVKQKTRLDGLVMQYP
ncbi:MAG: SPOR domain-containing protein [Pseudomonadota bacterium]|nr:SPOR domain-containing protein [Pseudomonadota bacterium]